MTIAKVSLSATHVDARGLYTLVITEELGRCGSCGEETSCFITRNGRTECTMCDRKRGENEVSHGARQ